MLIAAVIYEEKEEESNTSGRSVYYMNWSSSNNNISLNNNSYYKSHNISSNFTNQTTTSATKKKIELANLRILKNQISKANSRQIVRNLDRFGPVDEVKFVIAIQVHYVQQYKNKIDSFSSILFQVHNRSLHLSRLLSSLSKVRGINDSLIVLSHDLWDSEVNRVARKGLGNEFIGKMVIFCSF